MSDARLVIWDVYHGGHLHDHVVAQGVASVKVWQWVNQMTLDKATQSFLVLYQLWAAKQASSFCSVGMMMKKWGLWLTDVCPCY